MAAFFAQAEVYGRMIWQDILDQFVDCAAVKI